MSFTELANSESKDPASWVIVYTRTGLVSVDRLSVSSSSRRGWQDTVDTPVQSAELLLPAAAEGPIQLHQALVLAAPRLRQSQLSIEKRSLSVQDFEIGRRTASIAHL